MKCRRSLTGASARQGHATWTVLARSGRQLPEEQFLGFARTFERLLNETDKEVTSGKYPTFEEVIQTLTKKVAAISPGR